LSVVLAQHPQKAGWVTLAVQFLYAAWDSCSSGQFRCGKTSVSRYDVVVGRNHKWIEHAMLMDTLGELHNFRISRINRPIELIVLRGGLNFPNWDMSQFGALLLPFGRDWDMTRFRVSRLGLASALGPARIS